MSQRTRQNISTDGLDNRCDRLRAASATGIHLTYPEVGPSPTVYKDGKSVLRRNTKVMTAREEVEHGKRDS